MVIGDAYKSWGGGCHDHLLEHTSKYTMSGSFLLSLPSLVLKEIFKLHDFNLGS